LIPAVAQHPSSTCLHSDKAECSAHSPSERLARFGGEFAAEPDNTIQNQVASYDGKLHFETGLIGGATLKYFVKETGGLATCS
jgi:hypothetical protein